MSSEPEISNPAVKLLTEHQQRYEGELRRLRGQLKGVETKIASTEAKLEATTEALEALVVDAKKQKILDEM